MSRAFFTWFCVHGFVNMLFSTGFASSGRQRCLLLGQRTRKPCGGLSGGGQRECGGGGGGGGAAAGAELSGSEPEPVDGEFRLERGVRERPKEVLWREPGGEYVLHRDAQWARPTGEGVAVGAQEEDAREGDGFAIVFACDDLISSMSS